MAHTPGPWELKHDKSFDGEKYYDGSARPDWVWVWGNGYKSVVAYSLIVNENDLSDYTLISAAPELLAACKAALRDEMSARLEAAGQAHHHQVLYF